MSIVEVPLHKRPRVRRIMRQGVADVIANSEFYNQDTFGEPSKENSCETECCLAGFIDWRENPDQHYASVKAGTYFRIGGRARELLMPGGFWTARVEPFKMASCWPTKYATAFARARTNEERALILRDRVEHWFETGE